MNNPDIPEDGRRLEAADEERTADEYAAGDRPTQPIGDQPTRPLPPRTDQPTERIDATERIDTTERIDATGRTDTTERIDATESTDQPEAADPERAERKAGPTAPHGGDEPAWSRTAAPAPPAPTPTPAPAQRPIRRGVPLGTLVFGLASLVVAIALLTNAFLDVAVNPAIVVVLILIGAGAIMVIGGIAATRRRRDVDGPGSDPIHSTGTPDPHMRG
ncbi:hypothetical protein [Zhihengliuella sp.]|uniref:hypothetical protein n=1 Tax=Zhihengliuella sp. TaxID=1954483 RepID=UPI0028116612|nr:hypothetical protein [Zhihengliuella sp.]